MDDEAKQARLAALQSIIDKPEDRSLPYQTSLSPEEEGKFQQWVKQQSVPFDPGSKNDYDMRGFYHASQHGDPRASTSVSPLDGLMHFSDAWKTPSHKSFSNESIYATHTSPHWEGVKLVAPNGDVPFLELPKKLGR